MAGQAFVQPVQVPGVCGVLAGAGERIVQPQIGAIDGFGLIVALRIKLERPSAWRIGSPPVPT